MKIDLDLLDMRSLEWDGIDYRDAPDFCDAYICAASWNDGTDLNDAEIEELNSDSMFVYEALQRKLY